MVYAYIGSKTEGDDARGAGITVFRVREDGPWEEIQTIRAEENPGYQVLDETGDFLYSVHDGVNKATSYRILPDGKLQYLNTIDLPGENPVYITVDHRNQYLITACFSSGHVLVIRREADGRLGPIVHQTVVAGKDEDSSSAAHQCIFDQSGKFLFVPTQNRQSGYSQVKVFAFDERDGSLRETDTYMAREWDEPRHLAVHPNNRFVYLLNEKGNSLTYLAFDGKQGKLEPLQILPSLPETYTGQNKASAVAISPSGEYVLAANRFHDSIVVYRVDQATGYLKVLDWYPTLGKTPRFAGFRPGTGKFYAANKDSDSITEMMLDETTGLIDYTGQVIPVGEPYCITFRQDPEP